MAYNLNHDSEYWAEQTARYEAMLASDLTALLAGYYATIEYDNKAKTLHAGQRDAIVMRIGIIETVLTKKWVG